MHLVGRVITPKDAVEVSCFNTLSVFKKTGRGIIEIN